MQIAPKNRHSRAFWGRSWRARGFPRGGAKISRIWGGKVGKYGVFLESCVVAEWRHTESLQLHTTEPYAFHRVPSY